MSKSATTTTFPQAGPRDATEPFDIMAQHRVACMAGVINPFVPKDLQVLDDTCLDGALSLGVNVERVTRLLPPLVAQRLDALRDGRKKTGLDYRAYSINFADAEIQRVMFGEQDAGSPAATAPATEQRVGALQLVVEEWTQAMLAQLAATRRGAIFRRSLIVCFQASWVGSNYACRDEHAVTLALETRTPDTLRLLVFDHHTTDYHYPVHAQLQAWMAARAAHAFRFVTREVVCLEDHVHNDEFMACMTVAYRVCLLLASLDEPTRIDESDADFENSEMYLRGELVRMLNWLDTNPEVASGRATVLASRTLSLPFFELTHRDGGLFLYLMPYRFFAAVTDRARVFDALDAAGVPRLCYDPKRVFVVAAKRGT